MLGVWCAKLIPTHGPASQGITLTSVSGSRAKASRRPARSPKVLHLFKPMGSHGLWQLEGTSLRSAADWASSAGALGYTCSREKLRPMLKLDAERYKLCPYSPCYVVFTAQRIFCMNRPKKCLIWVLPKTLLSFPPGETKRSKPIRNLDRSAGGILWRESGNLRSLNVYTLDADNLEIQL